MTTHSIHIQSPGRDLAPGPRRLRPRRRSAAGLPSPQRDPAAPSTASADRPAATRQPGAVGGGGVLRRWSVAELIARAAGAPRAFA